MKWKKGNRGDKRKIQMTRQFFDASDPQGHFFNVCTKFQVWIFFRCGKKAPYEHIHQQSHIFTSENRNILDRLIASRRFWKCFHIYAVMYKIIKQTVKKSDHLDQCTVNYCGRLHISLTPFSLSRFLYLETWKRSGCGIIWRIVISTSYKKNWEFFRAI